MIDDKLGITTKEARVRIRADKRITIPKWIREDLDIEEGTVVTIKVTSEDNSEKARMKVREGGRVTFPVWLREMLDIGEGSIVDIKVTNK